jgi:hypothetical protein
VPAAVHPAAVRRAAHLGSHLVEGEVERTHLVRGGGLGPDHGPLREGCQLHPDGSIVLARIALVLDLDLDLDDAMVVLLESGQLLLDVTPEPIRQFAASTRDHNFHVNLPLNSWFLVTAPQPARRWAGRDPGRGNPVSASLGVDGARPADLVFDPTIAC